MSGFLWASSATKPSSSTELTTTATSVQDIEAGVIAQSTYPGNSALTAIENALSAPRPWTFPAPTAANLLQVTSTASVVADAATNLGGGEATIAQQALTIVNAALANGSQVLDYMTYVRQMQGAQKQLLEFLAPYVVTCKYKVKNQADPVVVLPGTVVKADGGKDRKIFSAEQLIEILVQHSNIEFTLRFSADPQKLTYLSLMSWRSASILGLAVVPTLTIGMRSLAEAQGHEIGAAAQISTAAISASTPGTMAAYLLKCCSNAETGLLELYKTTIEHLVSTQMLHTLPLDLIESVGPFLSKRHQKAIKDAREACIVAQLADHTGALRLSGLA